MTLFPPNAVVRTIGMAGLLLSSTVAYAAPQLKFLRSTDLDSVGLRMRLMHDARERPLAAPSIYTYNTTASQGAVKVEMYDPTELWVADQHAGQWVDPAGNSLALCVLRYQKPTGFERDHVPITRYRQRVPREARSDTWSLQDATRWVRTFADDENARITESRSTNTRFKSLYQLDFEGTNGFSFGYLFRLTPRSTCSNTTHAQWHVALFALAPGTSTKTALTDVRRKFLPYISPIAIGRDKQNGPSARFQDHASRPSDNERSKAFIKSRTQVANSIQNLQDWWFVETANYILLSNLDARFRSMVKSLQSDLENVRASFTRLIPPRHPIDAVSVIRMFATQQEYVDYVDENYAWTVGLWSGRRKELIVRPVSKAGSADEKVLLKTTTYHEAFHQYLFYALNQRPTAPWFNEGHAALFEHVELSRRGLQLTESGRKGDVVRTLINSKELDLQTLIAVDYDEFYGDDDETRSISYSTAWALCYFLRKHAEPQSDSPYAAITTRYIEGAMTSGDKAKATTYAFDGINMDALQRDFSRFWTRTRDRDRAARVRLFQGTRP